MNIFKWTLGKTALQTGLSCLTTLLTDTTLSPVSARVVSSSPSQYLRALRVLGIYLESHMTRTQISGWHEFHPFPTEVREA